MENKPLLLGFASIIGIALIGFVSQNFVLEMTDLDQIDSNSLNEVVHVRGVVREYGKFNGGIRLLIEQDNFRIKVVYFTGDEPKPEKGMCIDVIGEIKNYKGSLEIEADELTLFIC